MTTNTHLTSTSSEAHLIPLSPVNQTETTPNLDTEATEVLAITLTRFGKAYEGLLSSSQLTFGKLPPVNSTMRTMVRGLTFRPEEGDSAGNPQLTPDGTGLIVRTYLNNNRCKRYTTELYKLETRELIWEILEYGKPRRFQVSSDGKYALKESRAPSHISGALTVDFIDLKTGKTLKVLTGHTQNIKCMRISPDGKKAYTGTYKGLEDATLKHWDLETAECVKTLPIPKGGEILQISQDGTRAISLSKGNFLFWDLETGEILQTLKGGWSSGLSTFAEISFDNTKAVSLQGDYVKVWNLETGSCISTFNNYDIPNYSSTWPLSHLLFKVTPDMKYAIISQSTDLVLLDLERGQCQKIPNGQDNCIFGINISSDGTQVILESLRGIELWHFVPSLEERLAKIAPSRLSRSDRARVFSFPQCSHIVPKVKAERKED